MNDMLNNIEYLREKADVSYEEAAALLEANDGNVMRVLVELEQQGRVYQQGQADAPKAQRKAAEQQGRAHRQEAREKASNWINKAFQNRMVIEKQRADGSKQTVANLTVPVVIGATILAPYLAVATAVITFASGYSVKIKNDEKAQQPA